MAGIFSATLQNKLKVMMGKPLYILGKHGEVAFYDLVTWKLGIGSWLLLRA